MSQFELDFAPASTGIVHIVVPNMATLCCEDYLVVSDRGDRPAINPHHVSRSEVYGLDGSWRGTRVAAVRWRNVTCVWCRSLGRAFYQWVCSIMSGRDPQTGEPRNVNRERALLAGIEPG